MVNRSEELGAKEQVNKLSFCKVKLGKIDFRTRKYLREARTGSCILLHREIQPTNGLTNGL